MPKCAVYTQTPLDYVELHAHGNAPQIGHIAYSATVSNTVMSSFQNPPPDSVNDWKLLSTPARGTFTEYHGTSTSHNMQIGFSGSR
jgi:hypothetical protein